MIVPTMLLSIVLLYWIVAIVGGLGLDFGDFDLDLDVDFETDSIFHEVMSAGALSLRFLNLGNVPINIWISVFALSFWTFAMLWSPTGEVSVWMLVTVVARNAVLGLIPTKILTQPLVGRFETVEVEDSEALIGRVGTVATAEVTPKGGQARFQGEMAPFDVLRMVRQDSLPIVGGDGSIAGKIPDRVVIEEALKKMDKETLKRVFKRKVGEQGAKKVLEELEDRRESMYSVIGEHLRFSVPEVGLYATDLPDISNEELVSMVDSE
ncbi:MAG: hypothetical protein CMJ64_13815 [Planctomycetaceae bacterium]|nr:hypothetical protein [Planctomycetaceae bacterium]